jgi:hypothetical protein
MFTLAKPKRISTVRSYVNGASRCTHKQNKKHVFGFVDIVASLKKDTFRIELDLFYFILFITRIECV